MSDWSDFTVRIYGEVIRVDFKQDPRIDVQGKKLIAMLEKAGFKQEVRRTEWVRSSTDFWLEQCRKLAVKFGATVVDKSEHYEKAPNIIHPIDAMRQQLELMQTELAKLRGEVEELKKDDGLGV